MRANGILMHLTSLPSPHGIGTMGKAAREFVDFLAEAGQRYWQILPLCPTGYGDSPYQSFSTFAGNPYLIDLDLLAGEGLLKPEEITGSDGETGEGPVRYDILYRNRFGILRKAADRFLAHPEDGHLEDYFRFAGAQEHWLKDYSLFMALKEAHGGASWRDWEEPLRRRDPEALERQRQALGQECEYWSVMQYFFSRQWRALKEYANSRGIRIIGDLPIYVALDSADVWAAPREFQLDENLDPTEVAGCPPDGFSAEGQLWGNPLFDWEKMAEGGFAWWIRRMRHALTACDVVRIDHFRGFAGYYAIPFGSRTAAGGRWRKGPGMQLFHALEQALGKREIIAEDLGFLTPEVEELLRESGFPGMKLLQFAFDSRDGGGAMYLPERVPEKCVYYTGTHDNEPVLGWMKTAPPEDVRAASEKLGLTPGPDFGWGMMRAVWSSRAELTVVTAQDVLGLGHEARMNTPSVLGGNWTWRALPGAFTPELARRLRREMEKTGRLAIPGRA